jgi:hypothetical protein
MLKARALSGFDGDGKSDIAGLREKCATGPAHMDPLTRPIWRLGIPKRHKEFNLEEMRAVSRRK